MESTNKVAGVPRTHITSSSAVSGAKTSASSTSTVDAIDFATTPATSSQTIQHVETNISEVQQDISNSGASAPTVSNPNVSA